MKINKRIQTYHPNMNEPKLQRIRARKNCAGFLGEFHNLARHGTIEANETTNVTAGGTEGRTT